MVSTEQYEQMKAATVAEIALASPHSIEILNKYQLDYCCQGNSNFASACRKAGLDPELIWDEIHQPAATADSGHQLNFNKWNATMLIDFILQHHHAYVRDSIPQIQELLVKICQVHGETNPELHAVRNEFDELAEDLLNHLPKEEGILFPAIRRMEATENPMTENVMLPGSLRMPIRIMEDEHDRAGELIKSIRNRTNNYQAPAYACPTYQLAFVMLKEFDQDLIQHIHLENNILFPRIKSETTNQ